jgi:2-deoxy-D-gluconate 3-dehydrogenase
MADYNAAQLTEKAQQLVKEYGEGCVETIACDITDSESVKAMTDTIKAQGGDIDILINNAGISHQMYSIYEKAEDWNKVINLNLTAQFFVSQTVANEFFIPKKQGKIINMCSLGGIQGIPSAVAYSASKGGLIQVTKSLACEWARFGINVNAVCPGFVDTPLIADNVADDRWMNYMTMRTPMRRLARPDDVAGSVLFLASHLADYITGATLVIDGGMSAGA